MQVWPWAQQPRPCEPAHSFLLKETVTVRKLLGTIRIWSVRIVTVMRTIPYVTISGIMIEEYLLHESVLQSV
jgi:hypothetical protein